MHEKYSFWKSSWWLPLHRIYRYKGSERSLGLSSSFVEEARSCQCLRGFLVISEKVSKQKIRDLVTQAGPVKFSSGSNSNALMQRNLAICNDNQKILKSKISHRMVWQTPFEFPVRSTVKRSIDCEINEALIFTETCEHHGSMT